MGLVGGWLSSSQASPESVLGEPHQQEASLVVLCCPREQCRPSFLSSRMSTNADTGSIGAASGKAAAPASSAAGQSVNKRCAAARPPRPSGAPPWGSTPAQLRHALHPLACHRARRSALPNPFSSDATPDVCSRSQAAVGAHVPHDERREHALCLSGWGQHLPVDWDDHGRRGHGTWIAPPARRTLPTVADAPSPPPELAKPGRRERPRDGRPAQCGAAACRAAAS